mgnify:CR=1 FL=1
MNLSEKIRYLRIQKGMTQAELAEKLNTTKQTIGKYENQVVTNLPLNRVQELADALDTTPAYLMGWSSEAAETKKMPADASSADETDRNITVSDFISAFETMSDADILEVISAASEKLKKNSKTNN